MGSLVTCLLKESEQETWEMAHGLEPAMRGRRYLRPRLQIREFHDEGGPPAIQRRRL